MTVKIEVFFTPTCPHCPSAKALVREVASQFKSDVVVEEVNAFAEPARVMAYGIMSVPAIAVGGKMKFIGAPTKEELIKTIKEALRSKSASLSH